MSELIISVSGLRGVIGETLTPDVAIRYAAAFCQTLPPGPLVLSRDGRATGSMVADAVRSAVQAMGHDVVDAGVAATPTTGVLVRTLSAVGGIQVSASHNPPEFNGMKLFDGHGRVLTSAAGQPVVDHYRRGDFQWSPHDGIGQRVACEAPTSEHLSLVLRTVDVDQIRKRRFRVLLDSNHGAGSLLGKQLLEELGCELKLVGGTPDGQFAHSPEPIDENLGGICKLVESEPLAIGFCQDPDADRLAIIDENGRYLGEEYTLALCLDHILRNKPESVVTTGSVVTNCATSRMADDLASRHGATLFRSAVGEANVVELMLQQQAVFGGEGNGGPIDPRVGYVRDSFVGMAQVLDAMAARELPISRLADEIPRYEILKRKVSLDPNEIPAALDRLERHFSDAKADRLDGLRLDWDDRWLLIRASNTEAIVRTIAEAQTMEMAAALCDEARGVIERPGV